MVKVYFFDLNFSDYDSDSKFDGVQTRKNSSTMFLSLLTKKCTMT